MGVISRLGAWLDRKFPDKVNATDVMAEFLTLRAAINQLSEEAEKTKANIQTLSSMTATHTADLTKLEVIKDDLTKIKAIMQLKQKATVEMPNLTGAMPWKR